MYIGCVAEQSRLKKNVIILSFLPQLDLQSSMSSPGINMFYVALLKVLLEWPIFPGKAAIAILGPSTSFPSFFYAATFYLLITFHVLQW